MKKVSSKLDIEYINEVEKEQFRIVMGRLFNSPIHTLLFIDEVEKSRPFFDDLKLYREILVQLKKLPHIDQLRILESQDELGSSKRNGENKYAKNEHSSSGLNNLSPNDFDRFKYLNKLYKLKFGFNFLLAVSGLDSDQILSIFENKISNTFETEFLIAISQLEKLTFLRIRETFENSRLKYINYLMVTRNDCEF
tara:strand:+ start:107 stop:691 length:585 start_codon:yes stop_codon:yes gene_type:complete